jgi:hypothetical protein
MKTIPVTKLRNFYDSLSKLGLTAQTQLCILKDINNADKYKRLIYLYEESKEHFKKYENIDEPFLPHSISHRKPLPVNVETVSNTQDVISVLQEKQKRNNKIQVDFPAYDFIYLEREVPTCRATHAMTDEGVKGKSGSGGIDFIGFNCNDRLPVLGEIKVRSDQNTFYALIQLLTYLSELSTHKQIDRINRHNLFRDIPNLTEEGSFYLYLVSVNTNLGGIKNEILSNTQRLAIRLEKDITEIEKIVFIKMHSETKDITIIE